MVFFFQRRNILFRLHWEIHFVDLHLVSLTVLYTDGLAFLSPRARVTAILGHDTLDLTPANARR